MSDPLKQCYVVFVGRKPGIYTDWLECAAQVLGFSDSIQQAYPTRAKAEYAWRKYLHMLKHNAITEDISTSTNETDLSNDKGKTSTEGVLVSGDEDTMVARDHTFCPTSSAGLEFVPNCDPRNFLGHYPMQMWLRQAWNRLHTSEPMYTRHDYTNEDRKTYYRYRVSLKSNLFRFKSASVFGRYAYTDEQAKEDAAFKMMKLLAEASKMTVWDFNYNQVVELQDKVKQLEVDNFDITLENGLLNEEIKKMKKTFGHGN